MKAVLSGRSRIAINVSGSIHEARYLDEAGTCLQVPLQDAVALLSVASDSEIVEYANDDEINDALMRSDLRAESLDLVLFIFDGSLSEETRRCASEELSAHLSDSSILSYLKHILYVRPLPDTADKKAALRLSESSHATHSLIKALVESQNSIAQVRSTWDGTAIDAGKIDKLIVESLFIRHGVFLGFAEALHRKENLSNLVVRFSANTELKKSVPRITQILNTWITPLRHLIPRNARTPQVAVEPDFASTSLNGNDDPRHRKWDAARDAAVAQVEKIAGLVRDGKDSPANQVLDELIREQLKYPNGATHLVKSLCNIATKTTQWGRDDYAIECLVRALDLDSTDAVAYSLLGNHLRDLHKYDEARRAYDKAIQYSDPTETSYLQRLHSAKAHILTEQGKYDEALAEYKSIPFFGDDTGIAVAVADVYRKKGDYWKAMSSYMQIIAGRKEIHRAHAGKAEVAKRRGDPHRAIRIYNYILGSNDFELDSLSITVYNLAKCHLLKIVGQLDKALCIVRPICAAEPYNLGAQIQMASILALKNSEQDGLLQLSKKQNDDWRIHYLKGLALFRAGKIAEAKKELIDKLNLAQLLPEDEPLARSAQAFIHLASQDTEKAASILETVRPFDRHLKDLHQVFKVHIETLNQDQSIFYPKLHRSIGDLRGAVTNLRSHDIDAATLSEFSFLLRAA